MSSGAFSLQDIDQAPQASGHFSASDIDVAPAPKQYLPGRAFGMDVARGMGLDADKIAAAEDSGGQGAALKELGSQVLEGLKGVLKDPLSPIGGAATNFEDAVKSGSPGKIVGALSGILGGAEGSEGTAVPARAAETVKNAVTAPRDALAFAARDESGKLRPAVNAMARAGGAVAGHATGIPGAEIGGLFYGPSLADALIPSRETSVAKAVPITKSPNFNAAAYRAGRSGAMPMGNPTPFAVPTQAVPLSSLATVPNDLISRTQRLVVPGEMPTVEDLKRAGDLTQAPIARLRQLAKFGDRLAQNEINRRLKNP
jgi:hypothetical protein